MTIDDIRQKYIGDDAFSKEANQTYHHASKFKGRIDPETIKNIASFEVAEHYAKANKFKLASIGYNRNGGWVVYGGRMGSMTPTEAQAYAQDLLKAVAAIKKAPAIRK